MGIVLKISTTLTNTNHYFIRGGVQMKTYFKSPIHRDTKRDIIKFL